MIKKTYVVLLLIFFSACFFVFDGKNLLVRIQNCATATEIVVQLKEKKNVYSKKMFLILATSIAYQKKFKQRICHFSERTTMFNMVKSLTNSSKNVLRVTVPEGENIRQTAEIISKVLKIDKKKFIRIAKTRNMEGYLMPETYFFTSEASEAEIIDMMYFEFNKKITPFMYERAKKLNLDFKDIIIIASIVEKEAVESNERKIIAAVFLNRLNKKIKLQSCATVLYAMGLNKSRLNASDIKFDSPYNTYTHSGLPPGPICSPGLESIKATLYPTDTKNLFFVSMGNGKHLFAKNFAEHKKNKQIVMKRNKIYESRENK